MTRNVEGKMLTGVCVAGFNKVCFLRRRPPCVEPRPN